MGASVRGAIDLVLLLTGLARLRGENGMTRASARDAAHAALSGRIRIADGCDRTPSRCWMSCSACSGRRTRRCPPAEDGTARRRLRRRAPDGRGKADGERRATAAGSATANPPRRCAATAAEGAARRTISRAELAARHPVLRRRVTRGQAARPGRVRAAAGGRPGRRGDAAGRPRARHRPGPARRRAAAGRPGLLPAGPG